jgi:hypothetical protein
MSASPGTTWPPAAPPDRWGAGRVIALVLGVLLLIPGLGLLAGGGVLLWADQSQRDSDGYLLAPTTSLSSNGYALVSERLQLSAGADWVPVSEALGDARVRASGSPKDLFVGIAPTGQAAAYLRDVRRTVIDELGTDAAADSQVELPGNPPAAPPGDQDFWVAQASGTGPQQVDWEPAEGNWTIVIMNADGSPGVDADVRAGATLPAVTGIAWGLLIGGLLLTAIAVLLIVLAARPRRPRSQFPPPGQPDPVPVPAGPPPAWQPPAGR